MMARIYVSPTVEKQIRLYCDANGIEDINAFANRCALQGLNILKYGFSPSDNVNRENNGIKDISKNENTNKGKKESSRENEGKQENEICEVYSKDVKKQESEIRTNKKIRIIKKG